MEETASDEESTHQNLNWNSNKCYQVHKHSAMDFRLDIFKEVTSKKERVGRRGQEGSVC